MDKNVHILSIPTLAYMRGNTVLVIISERIAVFKLDSIIYMKPSYLQSISCLNLLMSSARRHNWFATIDLLQDRTNYWDQTRRLSCEHVILDAWHRNLLKYTVWDPNWVNSFRSFGLDLELELYIIIYPSTSPKNYAYQSMSPKRCGYKNTKTFWYVS